MCNLDLLSSITIIPFIDRRGGGVVSLQWCKWSHAVISKYQKLQCSLVISHWRHQLGHRGTCPPLPWSGHVPPPPLLELAHVQCTPVWQFLFTYGRLLWTPHIFLCHPQNHSRLSIGLTSIYYICVEIYVISALYFVNVPLLAQRPGDATVINNIKGGPKREAVDFKTPRSIFMIFAHLQSDTALG